MVTSVPFAAVDCSEDCGTETSVADGARVPQALIKIAVIRIVTSKLNSFHFFSSFNRICIFPVKFLGSFHIFVQFFNL